MARPTKLTPAVQEKVLQAIRGGNFRWVAAEWAGIGTRTIEAWMKRGRDRPHTPHGEFRRAVLEAEKAAEMRCVALVMKAATEDAKHAEWWLERKFPQRWGRKDRHEVTGRAGGPLTTRSEVALPAEVLADEKIRELLDAAAALANKLVAPPPPPTPGTPQRKR